MMQGTGHLDGILDSFVRFNASFTLQQIAQCPAAYVLHNQVSEAAGISKVIDCNDIAMFQAGHKLSLAFKTFSKAGLVRDLWKDDLTGNLALEAWCIVLVDLGHASLA